MHLVPTLTASRSRTVVGGTAAVLGGLVLLGWILDVALLVSVIPGRSTMKPDTAVGFVLAGLALVLKAQPVGRVRHWLAPLLAGSCAGIGVLSMAGYAFHRQEGLLQLGAPSPSRMGLNTALVFGLLGYAILGTDDPKHERRRVVEACAMAAAVLALIPLVGHLYGVTGLTALTAATEAMALHTSAMLVVVAVTVLLTLPGGWVSHRALGDGPGAAVARQLVPAVFAVLLVVGWLRLHAERRGWFEPEFGVALMVSVSALLLTGAVLWSAARLNDADADRRKAEQALRDRTRELARSNKELEQFAYVASHDLQEPLRTVASFAQLLSRRFRDQLGRDGAEFVDFMVQGATRMQRVIQDLLTFSRLGTRGAPAIPTASETALARVLEGLGGAIAETGATITHGPLPRVVVDPGQLDQLLSNLIGNGLKYRGSDSPRVHVQATRDGPMWTFSVRDNGIGIDPQYFERIFVVFQRLHGRDEYPGTGIGLAICKKIVERHGGRIWVDSQPAQGSTFFFTLPAVQEDA